MDQWLQPLFKLRIFGIAIVSPETKRWELVNSYLCNLLGYSLDELLSMTWSELMHQDDLKLHIIELNKIFIGVSEAYTFDTRMIRKNGETVYVLVNLGDLGNADDMPRQIFATVQDMTGGNRAECELIESESRYRTLADSGPALIRQFGNDKLCNYFNLVWLNFTGRTLEQERGYGWAEGVHPDDLDACLSGYSSAFDRREKFILEYRLRRHDGEYRWLQDQGSPCYNANSEFIGYLAHSLDITERKQVETELRIVTEVVEVSPVVLFRRLPNPEGVVLYVSDNVRRWGFTVAQCCSGEFGYSCIIFPDDIKLFIDEVDRYIVQQRDEFILEYRIFTATGELLWVEDLTRITRDVSGQILYLESLITDITERKRLDKLEKTRSFLLECITKCNHLEEILETITLSLESFKPGTLCSILLLDDQHQALYPGSAPSLPDFYNEAMKCLSIGMGIGSCGTAAYTGKRVVVEDVLTHPYWENYRELAKKAGLGSCWSEPIIGSNRKVLGTFAIYQRVPSLPDNTDIALIETAAHVTAIAIERMRAEMGSKLAAKLFAQSTEGFIVTDAECNIVMVNRAFTDITGFSEAEAIGRNPRLFAFGHDDGFDYEIWNAVNSKGYWEGEAHSRRKDGSVYSQWLSISRVVNDKGKVTEYIAMLNDISERKASEEHILKLAHFDTLTGLPNRTLLNDRAEHAISMAKRNHTQIAVMFLDLDHFKNINDSLGHRVGDELLIQVARRMKASIREEDTVARPGGDEFILIVLDTHVDGAAHVAEKLLRNIAQAYLIDQFELMVTLSIGIAVYPEDGANFQALCRCADTAMYRAKRGGRNSFRFFTAEMQAHSARTQQIENAMRRAIESHQLFLHYQPQISLQTGRVVGAEALIRWFHPELGLISPAEFIPIAEDCGQIIKIGTWVLRTAIHQLKNWLDSGLSPISIAVNLSSVQFRQVHFFDLVARLLEEEQLPARYLELELTERVAMDDPIGAIAIMNQLYDAGIRMSIDDFGTGYSSLNYLKRFNVYKLKIDQSFVRDVNENPEDKAIVSAIINLSKSLGFKTIAEGVETVEQLDYLREQGCDEVQGYFFSKPLPPSQFMLFVKDKNKR